MSKLAKKAKAVRSRLKARAATVKSRVKGAAQRVRSRSTADGTPPAILAVTPIKAAIAAAGIQVKGNINKLEALIEYAADKAPVAPDQLYIKAVELGLVKPVKDGKTWLEHPASELFDALTHLASPLVRYFASKRPDREPAANESGQAE